MSEKEQKIEFPTSWSYRIIVETAKIDCYDTIVKTLKKHGIDIKPEKKNKSSCGKYQSYRIPLILDSQEMMDTLSTELSALDGVKFLF